MLRVLADWDSDYLEEIDAMEEGGSLDKKRADGLTPDEVAKQACAFANAGGGFVVFGMKDAKEGRGFDEGVLAMMGRGGREPVKSWIEALIPKQHEPPIVGCEAQLIRRPGQAADRGVLVLYIPLSESHPHWVKSNEEIGYLRVGEHSAPMRRQTFLDLANRNIAPVVEIGSLNVLSNQKSHGPAKSYVLNPVVKVVSGPVCSRWLFELKVPEGVGQFQSPESVYVGGSLLVLKGRELLFPGRATTVSGTVFTLILTDPVRDKDKPLEAILYTESARPVRRTFVISDLEQ